MPDPLFYGQTLLGTLLMGWLLVRILALRGGDSLLGENTVAGVVGVTAAAVTGLAVLQIHFRLPPHNGLDRFLVIVLPMACGIELVASWWRLSRTTEIIVRGLASATCGGVLLYGSVHLQPLSIVWSVVSLLLCAIGLGIVWDLLSQFSQRTRDAGMLFALSLALLCTGILIMMAGYLNGGAAALPLAAALCGGAVATYQSDRPASTCGMTGLGIVALFGLLVIGRYFGGLPTITAVIVFLAPLLAWYPANRMCKVPTIMQRPLVRLCVVAIPLAVIVWQAKKDFDRKMRPLLEGPVSRERHESPLLFSTRHKP